MKTVFRFTAAACAAAALLASVQVTQSAQDGPELVERTYNLRGLTLYGLESEPRTGAIRDVLAPDRNAGINPDHEYNEWNLRDSGAEAMAWEYAGYLIEKLSAFVNTEGDSYNIVTYGETSIRISTTPEMHRRLAWAMSAIREVADARVSVTVHRLPAQTEVDTALPAATVPGLAKGSRLVGTSRGGLADPLVIQKIETRQYIADYDVNMAAGAFSYAPTLRTLATGHEVVCGVVSLPDGTLWVQGWHAAASCSEIRKVSTSGGEVELPNLRYSWTPVSAVIENGGAVVIDAGAGERLMLSARCDRTIKDQTLKLEDGTELMLLNMTGKLRSHGLNADWLMTPNMNQSFNDGTAPQIFVSDPEDGPYNDAAIYACDRWNADEIPAYVVGPLMGVVMPNANGDEALETAVRRARTAMAERDTGDRISLRVRTFEVADDAALPAGVLVGRPGAADIAELGTLSKGGMDRKVALRQQHLLDLIDVRYANHVHNYSVSTATGISAEDPEVAALVTGAQIRLAVNPVGDGVVNVNTRVGITAGDDQFEQIKTASGWAIERKRIATTQAHFNDDMKVGDLTATVCPSAGPTGRLVVIVVERLK